MGKQDSLARETAYRAKCRPIDTAAVKHFRMVGVERVEITMVEIVRDGDEFEDYVACQMDEVISVFGTDNLE